MQSLLIIVLIILAAIIAVTWLLLRSGQSLRRAAAQLDRDWSDIERFIKQRNDELPRLIQICRSYMPGDRATLKALSEARADFQKASSPEEKTGASARVTAALEKLFSEAGKYEGLKNNSVYMQLRTQLLEAEERIAERRDLYDDDAARFNARLKHFPGSIMKGKLKPHALP